MSLWPEAPDPRLPPPTRAGYAWPAAGARLAGGDRARGDAAVACNGGRLDQAETETALGAGSDRRETTDPNPGDGFRPKCVAAGVADADLSPGNDDRSRRRRRRPVHGDPWPGRVPAGMTARRAMRSISQVAADRFSAGT